jgi:hypothetical protein
MVGSGVDSGRWRGAVGELESEGARGRGSEPQRGSKGKRGGRGEDRETDASTLRVACCSLGGCFVAYRWSAGWDACAHGRASRAAFRNTPPPPPQKPSILDRTATAYGLREPSESPCAYPRASSPCGQVGREGRREAGSRAAFGYAVFIAYFASHGMLAHPVFRCRSLGHDPDEAPLRIRVRWRGLRRRGDDRLGWRDSEGSSGRTVVADSSTSCEARRRWESGRGRSSSRSRSRS